MKSLLPELAESACPAWSYLIDSPLVSTLSRQPHAIFFSGTFERENIEWDVGSNSMLVERRLGQPHYNACHPYSVIMGPNHIDNNQITCYKLLYLISFLNW